MGKIAIGYGAVFLTVGTLTYIHTQWLFLSLLIAAAAASLVLWFGTDVHYD